MIDRCPLHKTTWKLLASVPNLRPTVFSLGASLFPHITKLGLNVYIVSKKSLGVWACAYTVG